MVRDESSREEQTIMTLDASIAARLKRNADGLFTAVVQERGTGQVLMVAWMDDDRTGPHPGNP